MKDLAFMHEGNESTIEGLVNFDKLRMLAKELRSVVKIRSRPYNPSAMFNKKDKVNSDAVDLC